MKNLKNIILCLGIIILMNSAVWAQDVYKSWFTDATTGEFTNYGYSSGAISRPAGFPTTIESTAYGTRGKGADISTSGSFSTATFSVGTFANKSNGGISFWICPQENGELASGGAEHYILRGGSSDLSDDGFRISWDNRSGYGVLNFIMVGSKTVGGDSKLTSCQYDISGWTAGEWHHVLAAWGSRPTLGSTSKALILIVDRTEVVSVVFGGESFMDYSGTNVTIGGGTYNNSGCYIDGLIFRENISLESWSSYTPKKIAYRDFFLTAPYTSIEVTNKPFGASNPYAPSPGAVISLPADPWVLLDKRKQFGVIGIRKLNASGTQKVTEYLTCYEDNRDADWGGWYNYDAKPVITWEIFDSSNSASLIDVNVNGSMIKTGLVEGDVANTGLYIIATFREPYSTGFCSNGLSFSVRAWEGTGNTKPDLGIMHVSREARYDRTGVKSWPAPGELVDFTVHFGNFGTADVAANSYRIKFEYAVDTNNNFRIDPDEVWMPMGAEMVNTPLVSAGTYFDESHDDLKYTVTWPWPASAGDPTGLNSASQWIRVTLDSTGELTEICEANNTRTEKTNARAFRMGYHKEPMTGRPIDYLEVGVDKDYREKVITMVGSFSEFDWMYSHLERVNIMLQTTKSPTVSAVGIQEGLRLDDFYEWVYPEIFPHNYNELDANMFDGSYSEIRIKQDYEWRSMSLYTGECHELGHTGLRLPDLYGTNYSAYNVFSGVTPGSAEFPIVSGNSYNRWDSQGILSSH
ncbi:MAG: hypothetical protein JXJ04_13395, partial [Spirochaetales bacterium]|nr:hypothetical protein [Spirochaetales bacterium]